MGSFEYYHTSFSYQRNDTGEECFVGVPEQGGRNLIWTDPLAPGALYTASVAGDGTVGLYRLEVAVSAGAGKLRLAGGVSGTMKESLNRAFSYLSAHKVGFGLGREVDESDLHVEVMDLMNSRVDAELGVAFFVAAFSALENCAGPDDSHVGGVGRERVALGRTEKTGTTVSTIRRLLGLSQTSSSLICEYKADCSMNGRMRVRQL